jgi:hypothetical protein
MPSPCPSPGGRGNICRDSVLDIPLFIFNAQSTVGDGVLDIPLFIFNAQSTVGDGVLDVPWLRKML